MALLTVQPSTKDTNLASSTPAVNYGTSVGIGAEGSTTQIVRALLQFSIAALPPGITINSASLQLYYIFAVAGTPTGRTYNAYRLLRLDWVELQATWNIYKAASNWSTPGAGNDGLDFTSVNGANAIVPAVNNWMSWDVKDQVIWAFLNGVDAAFRISDSVEDSVVRHQSAFPSRDEAVQTTLRPKLVIDYTPAPAAAGSFAQAALLLLG